MSYVLLSPFLRAGKVGKARLKLIMRRAIDKFFQIVLHLLVWSSWNSDVVHFFSDLERYGQHIVT